MTERCTGRYPVPHQREEPFQVTYRCGFFAGHQGPCGPWEPNKPAEADAARLLEQVRAIVLRRAIAGHTVGGIIIDGILHDLEALEHQHGVGRAHDSSAVDGSPDVTSPDASRTAADDLGSIPSQPHPTSPVDAVRGTAALYPCADCGVLRTKEEGGTTFTVCEACWDKHYGKKPAHPDQGTAALQASGHGSELPADRDPASSVPNGGDSGQPHDCEAWRAEGLCCQRCNPISLEVQELAAQIDGQRQARGTAALGLVERLTEDSPFEVIEGEYRCFFCRGRYQNGHKPDCTWVEARALLAPREEP